MIYELEELELERESGCSGDGLELRTPDEALIFYRSLLGTGSAVAFVECGEAFRAFEMNEEALRSYDEAIARDIGCLAAYLGRGELYFERAVLAIAREEVQEQALRAVADFRKGMLVSLGSTEVVWKLGTALLIVGDAVGARALAENVLIKIDVVSGGVRRDFLHLLGFAELFSGDPIGAGVCAAELLSMEGDEGEGGFLKVAISIVSGGCDGLTWDVNGGASSENGALLEAGERLRLSGCREFLDVARALGGLSVERKG